MFRYLIPYLDVMQDLSLHTWWMRKPVSFMKVGYQMVSEKTI
jgi:hypothetical protein